MGLRPDSTIDAAVWFKPQQRHQPATVLKWASIVLGIVAGFCLLGNIPAFAAGGNAGININFGDGGSPQSVSNNLQILILLTVLTLAPAILMMGTAFTRIVIVLSLTRQAIGSPMLPPTQVLIGLALILTFFVMSPTIEDIQKNALDPYFKNAISQEQALTKAMAPVRLFMFRQVHEKDVELFMGLAKLPRPKNTHDVPTHVLLPAFIISELKTAFQLGFVIFLPFIIIDIVVSSILVAMGMMFLPPATISLPFKIILFVLVDGWQLICKALVTGFS